ncbi:putative chloride channel-like protein CLC-g [Hordeum vulgare]|nr:putative chloride channel-like protein CLC-g [Hordeum vulgare]
MEKLKFAKEQRCILQSQADIIQNMRKAMKEVKVDRDLLKEEKKKLEYLIADLLKAGHCTKEKLERIKVIDLALKLINPVIEPGEVLPNVNGIHLVLAGELRDHHVVGVESTLHHPLALEDLLLHCFEPRLLRFRSS